MKPADIEAFFATLRDANPQPASELVYSSVFELLAAVLLSAQATDVSVNKATRALFAAAPTPQKMLELGAAGVSEAAGAGASVPPPDLPHADTTTTQATQRMSPG